MLKPIILIVDDEREHRSMLSAILKRDHHVLTAPDGESALRMAEEETLDLALVDQRMPGMTGIEVLQSLRETQPRCGRILVTAYTDAELLQEAINRAAVYRFFSKPCDPELLRLDVKRAIEHQRAQNDLRRTERLAVLGGLASTVAHDMNNYLTPLLNASVLLEDSDAETTAEVAEHMQDSAHALKGLFDELLSLAKGQLPKYIKKPTDLAAVVRTARSVCVGGPFDSANIVLNLDAPLPKVPLSSSRCMRLVTNLLRNAVDACGPQCNIEVSLKSQGHALELRVSDDGPGVAPEVMPHLFDPLFSTKSASTHSGLGLAICQTIMEGHGGELQLESAVGHGATFIARFPMEGHPS